MKISRPQYGLEEELVQAIYALREKKSSDIFREPVDPKKFPDYYEKIKNPMDLSTILKKLKAAQYRKSEQIHNELLLITSNCNQYNMVGAILKKSDQFEECIKTVWGNFKKQIEKKGINYNQEILINEEILSRINLIEEKKNRKKVTALQSVIEQEKKNILPDSPFLPPIAIQPEKNDRQELPQSYHYRPEKYLQVSREEKKHLLVITLDRQKVVDDFQSLSNKKLQKYRKIIRKKLNWFDKKIIQKCLKKKRFKKMLVPNHLNVFLEREKIAEDLSIRKLQMYIKQITYWIQDNSTILNDYMKDKFIDHCKQVRKCIIRVIKYRKIHKTSHNNHNAFPGILSSLPPIKEPSLSGNLNIEEKEEIDNYENKMKEFKRMLERDRASSAKRDTKIILKNQNGEMQVIDWTNEKKININDRGTTGGGTGRGTTNKVGDTLLMNQNDYNQKKRNEERRRLEIRRDEQFIEDYQKKSNVLIIGKYRATRGCNLKKTIQTKLQIDWSAVCERQFQLPKQILFNTDDDI